MAIGSGSGAAANGAVRSAGRGPRLKWLAARGSAVGLAAGGAPMNRRLRALLRLLAVQGTWNYERMLGVGMGYAAEPLLEDLKTVDPVRHGEAVVRSAEFFNCNPNLAGLALGATARAEYEAVPGAQIARLRTALCSPLGALGDELFWAGLVPALVGLRSWPRCVLGARWWAIAGLPAGSTTCIAPLDRHLGAPHRIRRGHAASGAAIGSSWLPEAIARVGPGGRLRVGLAMPAGGRLVSRAASAGPARSGRSRSRWRAWRVTRWFGPALTSVRFALLAMVLLLLFRRIGL